MAAKKHGRAKTTKHNDATEQAESVAPSVPTYETDGEIKAARLAHGPDYDRLIAKGTIVAPTRDELPDAELDERLAVAEEKRAKKEAKE